MIVKRKLYSQVEEKMYAKKDYEGLSEAAKAAKLEVRNDLAKVLKANRKNADKRIDRLSIPVSEKNKAKKEIRESFKRIYNKNAKEIKSRDNKHFEELGKINKNFKKSRNALVGVAGLTAIGTGAYLVKKHHDKKNNEKKED